MEGPHSVHISQHYCYTGYNKKNYVSGYLASFMETVSGNTFQENRSIASSELDG